MRDGDDVGDDDGGAGGMARKGQCATEWDDDASLLPIPDQETEIHSSRKRRRKKMRKRTKPEKRSDRPMMREGELLSPSPSPSNLEGVRGSKGENEGDVVTWARPCWRWSDGWWSSPGLLWRHSDFWGE